MRLVSFTQLRYDRRCRNRRLAFFAAMAAFGLMAGVVLAS